MSLQNMFGYVGLRSLWAEILITFEVMMWRFFLFSTANNKRLSEFDLLQFPLIDSAHHTMKIQLPMTCNPRIYIL